jgi:SAM-dependent methyltransferase
MFPLLYHAHHRLYQEDLPFWHSLALKHPGTILELGCGTGRVLTYLAKAGLKTVGLDINLEMLKTLKHNLPKGLSLEPSILQADFTVFHLAAKFGLIILPCNTYSTCTADQRKQLLQRVLEHLQTDGVFALSMPNPEQLMQQPGHSETELEEIFPHPLDGEPVQVSSEWERNDQTLTILWHYDHLLSNGSVERLTAQNIQYINSVEYYQQEFRLAGFHILHKFGDYKHTPYDLSSPDLIFILSQ